MYDRLRVYGDSPITIARSLSSFSTVGKVSGFFDLRGAPTTSGVRCSQRVNKPQVVMITITVRAIMGSKVSNGENCADALPVKDDEDELGRDGVPVTVTVDDGDGFTVLALLPGEWVVELLSGMDTFPYVLETGPVTLPYPPTGAQSSW